MVAYILSVLALLTLLASTRVSKGQYNYAKLSQGNSQARARRDDAEIRRHYRTTDYDEPEPTDPVRAAQRKAKQKRYNGASWVGRNISPEVAEAWSIPERHFDFPALPVDRSDAVVLVGMIDAQAHLSEDKHNIYSEFTVHIERVFKAESPKLVQDSEIIVDRVGGFVLYPDGRKILYRVAGCGMPHIGGRYVLFLNSIHEKNDYSILTGYELSPSGVASLDESPQFFAFDGYDEASFLKALNDASKTKSP